MEVPVNSYGKKFYRLVLTGGPCGGKTTAQTMLTSVFEQLGWKVYRTAEVATILFSGGVKITETTPADRFRLQENIMKILLQIEQAYYDLAMTQTRDVLLICDRGFMDAVAYLDDPSDWNELKALNNWNDVELRDKRYDQVCHLVTAADGAETFYTNATNTIRSESQELAKLLDQKCQLAWVGHPYFDVIDNTTDFPEKVNRLVRCVAYRMGIDLADRFDTSAIRRRWLVTEIGPDSAFPKKFEDFQIQYIQLVSPTPDVEVTIRRRGNNSSVFSYQIQRCRKVGDRYIETHQQLTRRDFEMFASQRDMGHAIVEVRRRCFLYKNHYFQLDNFYLIPETYTGLKLITTYTLRERQICMPEFLKISREVTDDPAYSPFNLTKKPNTGDKENSGPSTETKH